MSILSDEAAFNFETKSNLEYFCLKLSVSLQFSLLKVSFILFAGLRVAARCLLFSVFGYQNSFVSK